jgi:hypothetical protein
MQPILRLTDYIREYKDLTYDLYAGQHNIVPTTYYSLDRNMTTYDENYVGTYYSSGSASGKKWNKIHLFPVLFSGVISPAMNSGEKGISYHNNLTDTVVIDPISGVVPKVGDLLEFNISGHYGFWEIINADKSGALTKPYYRVTVQLFRPHTNDSQMDPCSISNQYIFIEYDKRIYPINTGTKFIRRMSRLNQTIDKLNSVYNHNFAGHFVNNYYFPELESILATFDTITPPTSMLLYQDLGQEVKSNSLMGLLLTPDLVENPSIHYTMTKTNINPAIKLFSNYIEYSSSPSGEVNLLDLIYTNKPDLSGVIDNINKVKIVDSIAELNTVTITDPINKLVDETIQIIYNPEEEYYDEPVESIGDNLLEYVVEYCAVSRKLLKDMRKAVTFF